MDDRESAQRELLEAGRAAWPALALDGGVFLEHVAALSRGGACPAPTRAADLYLACACAHAVPGALEAFERTFAADAARAIALVDSSRAFVDDVLQVLRQKLFVSSGRGPPKIASYAGRAALQSWLSAAAVRTAMSLRRKRAERGHDAVPTDTRALTEASAPELVYLKVRYKPHFEAAIRAALARLSTRDRTLLRLHLADRLGIDGLARVYSVGRSTAARWLAAAREALVEQTRAELCQKLNLTASEYESIARLVRSELEVSVIRHLEDAR